MDLLTITIFIEATKDIFLLTFRVNTEMSSFAIVDAFNHI